MTGSITMAVSPQYFRSIVDGRKTIEGRLLDKKRKRMVNDGVDTVIFICTASDRRVTRKIVKFHNFHTFFEAAQVYYQEMIPWANSPEETAEAYGKFYTFDEQWKCGVVLLELSEFNQGLL